ncbi:TetR/AcrR family transcriptional regulator [Ottowia testudinis]|uniref:WHG domain-containing protein n=1 Tax=Ottowia testudinis TaxID=2816950 RepID=A0A975CJM8_9BURK|nr:TetR-like C-terminal domain-containing protein [Ottowia testudinis]QTD46301.1 WHG domain-containing protein [Ottowia testudinis]
MKTTSPSATLPAPTRRAASDATERRRQKELRARRQALLAAARKLLRKGGAQAVTLRAVADAVGVSTTVVYALFADKAALISQAVDDDLKRFSRHLEQAVAGAADARDAVRRSARAYVAFGVAHPQAYRLMFMEPRPASAIQDSSITFGNPSEDAYALACALVTGLLQETGRALEPANVETAAQLLWESLHGATSLRIALGDDPWFQRLPLEQHVDRLIDVFIGGLLSPP